MYLYSARERRGDHGAKSEEGEEASSLGINVAWHNTPKYTRTVGSATRKTPRKGCEKKSDRKREQNTTKNVDEYGEVAEGGTRRRTPKRETSGKKREKTCANVYDATVRRR